MTMSTMQRSASQSTGLSEMDHLLEKSRNLNVGDLLVHKWTIGGLSLHGSTQKAQV
ncbi:hypothetical protein Tsubulata_015564 [Turnera subulata]|uniref:Uncharacterized protein n=1 Tax=Turnera subulata TaxID=218843 RepID=A0A9Q0FDH5_9ROSI|nr:hypothetical protein Tsubulata_015564 [Turnera subulata]